jgi:EamA domain-containing membrane protein RarD
MIRTLAAILQWIGTFMALISAIWLVNVTLNDTQLKAMMVLCAGLVLIVAGSALIQILSRKANT